MYFTVFLNEDDDDDDDDDNDDVEVSITVQPQTKAVWERTIPQKNCSARGWG